MSELAVQVRLDSLFELGITLAELEEEKAQAIEAVIPDKIREHIKQIETEFADRIQAVKVNYANTEAAVKNDVLALGFTVRGANNMMAVWYKGRVTWDNKGLDGYMVAHPEIEAFRREGKPSVSIRRRK